MGRSGACWALVFACPIVWGQTDTGLWRYAHPNAKALIGIDVEQVRKSQMAEQFRTQVKAAKFPMSFPGMEFLNAVDRVIISSPGRVTDNPKEEPPVLIAVRGHFDLVKLRQALVKSGAKPQAFQSLTIYRPQEKANSDFGFAPLDSETLLIGDANSLFQTIERLKQTPEQSPSILQRARQLDSQYEFWAILTMPPAAMASSRVPFAEALQNLTGLEAGFSVRDGLAFQITLNALTEAAAKEIGAHVLKLVRLAAKDKEMHPEFSGFDKKLKVAVDNTSVQLGLKLDAQEMARLAKALEKNRMQRPGQAQAVLAPKPQPVKQVIRIEGLDDGPREIPVQRPDRDN